MLQLLNKIITKKNYYHEQLAKKKYEKYVTPWPTVFIVGHSKN